LTPITQARLVPPRSAVLRPRGNILLLHALVIPLGRRSSLGLKVPGGNRAGISLGDYLTKREWKFPLAAPRECLFGAPLPPSANPTDLSRFFI